MTDQHKVRELLTLLQNGEVILVSPTPSNPYRSRIWQSEGLDLLPSNNGTSAPLSFDEENTLCE